MLAIGYIVAAALAALQVQAVPSSNVTCIDQQWSFNSLQQSPCLVSAYLSAQCTSDNSWLVPEIGSEGPYSSPSGSYANVCRCNSVQWSLLSACSLCQGGPASTWTDWIGNCSQSVINIGTYPEPVPAGIAIPHWAYYDFTGTGVFNTEIAQQQSGPESSAPSMATSTSPISTASGATTRQIETATAVPISSSSKSSSNTGAIVGGVVGGVLGLALLILVVIIITRKSKRSPPKDNQHVQGGYNPSVPAQSQGTPVMGQYQPGMHHPGMMSPGPDHKPHDPSDPATFPLARPNNATSQYSQSVNYSQSPPQYRPGQYNGAPEV